ncbi:MAG: DUF3341 domain-containing protein [Pararhizobium sp.]
MTRALFVEFASADGLRAAVHAVGDERIEIIDAFTPFPIEGLGAMIAGKGGAKRVRLWMLVGGLGAAAVSYGLQLFSATIAYPFDVGARPHNSWPTFILFPFEFSVLMAGIAGLLGLFLVTGLPRLYHPIFEIEGFGRSSNDRFILALVPPEKKRRRARLDERMSELGATSIREVEL